ncbi:MAG: tautomerase family protein [Deltaproteobacteria bacterium]|nr:tautomerase family protein [Deltaproteobacteria bacterium]
MPIVRIETRKGWTRQEKDRLIQALHESMVACLQIPEYDKLIRLVEYDREDFVTPPACTGNYVLIEISLFSGRSLDAKRALYQTVVAKLSQMGVPANNIRVVLHEVPRDDWGIRGGVPASEVELGFKVDV